MLLCDALGLALPPWVLAEPIGKTAAKLPATLAADLKTAKKKAERAGKDKEAAARAVLLKPVKLKLPTADEIKAAWQRTVPAPPLSVPPAAPPSAQPPSPPPPAPNAEPIPEPEPELSDRACVIIAISRSEEASEAINYAFWVMNERRFGEGSQGGEEMTLIG
jgi:hypothetical protein